MSKPNNALLGAALIGVGCGMTAVGIALVVPACTNWTMGLIDGALRRGKEGLSSGIDSAASLAGQMAGKAQEKFADAAKAAKGSTVKAAGAVEIAARHVREFASEV